MSVDLEPAERERLDDALRAKRAGAGAFISNARTNMAESTVLAGSRSLGFTRILCCRLGNHRARANEVVRLYNAAPAQRDP